MFCVCIPDIIFHTCDMLLNVQSRICAHHVLCQAFSIYALVRQSSQAYLIFNPTKCFQDIG